jgi:uncharacterized protein
MRYLQHNIANDLKRKMVFLSGPRQVGKTTLTRELLKSGKGVYFNWDDDVQRKAILDRRWSDEDQLLVFDELHKFRRWKNWVKGVFDTQSNRHQILVTGSAQLDVYRRGGDSLLGRYHPWRLHPFTLSERPPKLSAPEVFQRLMTVGGFPEPFLDGNEREARRWRRERHERVLKDDVRDLENVRDIQTLGLFVDALRSRVGSMVVLANIAQDLQVAQKTLTHWLQVLERMYLVFVVRPFSTHLARALQKPPKVYFFDNADVVGDEGARFENLVACHLLKQLHFLEDRDGYRYELRYVRDKEGREVDFVIVKEGVVEELIEAKFSATEFEKPLSYFAQRLKPAKVRQIVAQEQRSATRHGMKLESVFDAFPPLVHSAYNT